MAPWIIPAGLALIASAGLLMFARCCRRCHARHKALAPLTDDCVRLAEEAGGYSHRSFVTKLGASRSVKVIVTEDSLVVDLMLPLGIFAEQIDMCHRIALSAIERVQAHHQKFGTECVITYRGCDGQTKQLSLFPESPDRFLRLLRRPQPVAV
jgi:hypothetical protein